MGSREDDLKRKNFILRVLLIAFVVLSACAAVRVAIDTVRYGSDRVAVPVVFFVGLISYLLVLLYLTKRGMTRLPALALIFSVLAPVLYMMYRYGTDLPQGLLTIALIVVMSGLLISARFSISLATAVGAILLLLGYLEHSTVYYRPDASWKSIDGSLSDTIIAVATLVVITVLSWLSNREIEASLLRAKESERALQLERDMLESRVAERTKELKAAQDEKIAQLSRFAEFGRTSSSILHDLLNSVTSVTLYFEQLKETKDGDIKMLKANLESALDANDRMIDYISNTRKLLVHQEEGREFSVNYEVAEAIKMLGHKASKNNVAVVLRATKKLSLKGHSARLHQAVINLISNAIDSYAGSARDCKEVRVMLAEKKGTIVIRVEDDGAGISQDNLEKIFEPFYTTKADTNGMGVGLAITKDSIERDFGGTLKVNSIEGKGSIFTVELPK